MKCVNLISLVQAYLNIDKSVYAKYLQHIKITPKAHEIDDLKVLIDELFLIENNVKLYNRFYFGYIIPQIGKEFDLLRFGKDSIINIELKRTSDEEKIQTQLLKNKYYLKFLKLEIISYTYVSSVKKLYSLDAYDNIIEVDILDLYESLENQITYEIDNIDSLFNPSDYLISPFNTTEKFVTSEYFLTPIQDELKKKITRDIERIGTNFVTVVGNAGTGKSLLTYDIAKYYLAKRRKVLVIHCGQINEGHSTLNDDYNWDVIPAKLIHTKDLSKFYLIVLDEAQRIFPRQLEHIIKQVKLHNGNCLFSYDKLQCLKSSELKNNIDNLITGLTSPSKYELTEKIRTNKEIAGFIKCLFDKGRAIHLDEKKNVELNYFQGHLDAKEYLELSQLEGWKIINYTPSRDKYPYDNFEIAGEDTTHRVIGQEFDKVIAVVDSHFYYNGNELSTRNFKNQPYYHPTKMLYQIVTRTRKKLNIVIVNNEEIMERCLDILKLPK